MAQETDDAPSNTPEREAHLEQGIRLELLTVGWGVVEAVVALAAAALSGSVALLAFGADSVVETLSGGAVLWRLRTEDRDPTRAEAVERRAQILVAAGLVLLALYVTWDAGTALLAQEAPQVSILGIAITASSVVVMAWLAVRKRRVAGALGSRAMLADAFQSSACLWLGVLALVGLALNALLGWWWADPAAALVMVLPLLWEAWGAWTGEDVD